MLDGLVARQAGENLRTQAEDRGATARCTLNRRGVVGRPNDGSRRYVPAAEIPRGLVQGVLVLGSADGARVG